MNKHITVLAREAVDALNLAPDSVVVDATLGSGGHTRVIREQLDDTGTLIALDADPSAIQNVKETQGEYLSGVRFEHVNFRELDTVLQKCEVTEVDAILADLGWRIEQFEHGDKGFSFQKDEPLAMTFGTPDDYPFTARDIINEWSEESLANVFKGYGEERYARRIARAIVAHRESTPIDTSLQLAELIKDATPRSYAFGKVHPATRSFQALRIAVNDELAALETFIQKAVAALAPGGRLAIISFHSLEDRIVKHRFREYATDGEGTVITKKPITATDTEIIDNPRARSAKLRIFQKHL